MGRDDGKNDSTMLLIAESICLLIQKKKNKFPLAATDRIGAPFIIQLRSNALCKILCVFMVELQ